MLIFGPFFNEKSKYKDFRRIEKLKIHEQKNGPYFFGKKLIKDLFSAKGLYYNLLLHRQLSATILMV